MEPIRRIERTVPRPLVAPVRRLRRPGLDEDREDEPGRGRDESPPRRPEEPDTGGLDVLA